MIRNPLIKRTFDFAIRSIDLVVKINKDLVNSVVLRQFLRSSTSIGANYREAFCAESKNDFAHKLGICRKESRETFLNLKVK